MKRYISLGSLAILFLLLFLWGYTRRAPVAPPFKPDPAPNPRYAEYHFPPGNRTIDLGTRPLALPEASVGELLHRDRILSGQLRAKGHKLRMHPFHTGQDVNFFLSRGNLEAGIGGDLPALCAASQEAVVVTALIKQGFSSIISRKPMMVRDLKGKRIATGLGSTAYFTLLRALDSQNLRETDVSIVHMDVNAMPAALLGGRIDAFSAGEPTSSMAVKTNPEFFVVHQGINLGFLYFSKEFVRTNPGETRLISAAVVRACHAMRDSQVLDNVAQWVIETASRFLDRPYSPTPELVVSIIRRDLISFPSAPRIESRLLKAQGLLANELNFLKKKGIIPSTTTWNQVRPAFESTIMPGIFAEFSPMELYKFDYAETFPEERP